VGCSANGRRRRRRRRRRTLSLIFTRKVPCAKYLLYILCMCEQRTNTSSTFLNAENKKFIITAVKTSKTCRP